MQPLTQHLSTPRVAEKEKKKKGQQSLMGSDKEHLLNPRKRQRTMVTTRVK